MSVTDKMSVTKERKKINKEESYQRQKKISIKMIQKGHMSTKQVARFCKVKESTVKSWVQRGILKPVMWRQGGPNQSHYFDKKEVLAVRSIRHLYKATSRKWICDTLAIHGRAHDRLNKYPNRKIHKKTLEKMNANKS